MVVLPFTSVTVTVILVEPFCTLPKAMPGAGFWIVLATPQLSASLVIPVTTFGIRSVQLASIMAVGQVKVGGVISRTVIVATQVLILPAPSVTVSVTLF